MMGEGARRRPLSVVMLGATGAVGRETLAALQAMPEVAVITTLTRRALPGAVPSKVAQHVVDVFDPATYAHLLAGHQAAVSTFGVGEPTSVSKEELVRVDKTAVIAFAAACKAAGVAHFEALSSALANATSPSHYLRTKGELGEALAALNFERLSIFHPSMILTPANRYGWSHGLTLAVWPAFSKIMVGRTSKFRGIPIATLGAAMAANLATPGASVEVLHWDEFNALAARKV
jgi:uncharacterized protein YbjT (DUF2867 family)